MLLCAAPASALADGSISGAVTDAATEAALTNATVCAEAVGPVPSSCVGLAADGEYTISGLPAAEYRVSFRPYPGINYVSQYWQNAFYYDDATLIALAQDEERTGIDANLHEGAEVSGTISGAGLGALEGARACAIEVVGSGYSFCGETDASGHYDIAGLRGGSYFLSFRPPYGLEYATRFYDGKDFFGEAAELEVTPGTIYSADAELSEAGQVEGTVTSAAGPLDEAWVCAYAAAGSFAECAQTNSSGGYVIHGLAASSYVLEFSAAGYRTQFNGGVSEFAEATPVEVSGGAATSGVDAAMAETPGIRGTITDAETGETLDGVRVCAIPEGLGHGSVCENTWNGGGYDLANLPADNYLMTFELAGYAVQYYEGVASQAEATRVSVSGESVDTIDAELSVGGVIAGEVVESGTATQISGVRVCALLANGNSVACDNTDAAGGYEIKGLPVGSYTIRFTRTSYITQFYNGKASEAAAEPVTVTRAETTSAIDAQLSKQPVVVRPTNLTAPELSGIAVVGDPLTCSPGTWANNPTTLEFAWASDVEVIEGAEASTYTPLPAEAGGTIQCGVWAHNSAGWTFAESNIVQVTLPTHLLTVAKAGSGAGTVISAPAGIECGSSCSTSEEEGGLVTLTATAASGSSFAGWSGGGCSGAGSCEVILNVDTAVTASFTAEPSGGVIPPPTPSPPTAAPAPVPTKKPLRCKKGFRKKTIHGKARCVKVKKHRKQRH
jgi:hypothetical protein